jgi:hypothetical protein
MMYFVLQAEVAGGLGPASVGDLKARPPRLVKFNYEFDVWLGDPLLEAMSNFIVTEHLKELLIEAHTSGISFGDVEVTKSEEYQDRHPDLSLPAFFWLKVTGQAGRDDFGLSPSGDLVVSKRIVDLLKVAGLRHSEISEYDQGKGR